MDPNATSIGTDGALWKGRARPRTIYGEHIPISHVFKIGVDYHNNFPFELVAVK